MSEPKRVLDLSVFVTVEWGFTYDSILDGLGGLAISPYDKSTDLRRFSLKLLI